MKIETTAYSHTACRLCAGPLVPVLDYGLMPPANALQETREAAVRAERFPQELLFCESCLLGQLGIVVRPEVLYKDYAYESSVSPLFLNHCRDLAKKIADRTPAVVLDIAGNDGALARAVLNETHADVFVIDPAQNEEPEQYHKIKKFWNEEIADAFVSTHGKADTITAQNVVGHVDDIKGFFRAVRKALADDGEFIVEIPSFVELVKSGAFDTVYHEHVSYWTVTAMQRLARETGFRLRQVDGLSLHCGSFRFWLYPVELFPDGTLPGLSEFEEREFFSRGALYRLAVDTRRRTGLLGSVISDARSGYGQTVIGVTASAKSSVLSNMIKTGHVSPVAYLVDDTPEKQGKFQPGTGAEIRPFTADNVKDADVAVILSRNLTVPLIEKLFSLGFKGVTVTV